MENRLKDPYVYTGTQTLKNKLNIRDSHELEQIELKIIAAQSLKPVPQGNFDYNHLKAVHQHLFEPLYEWAGKERTVSISKDDTLFALPHRINGCLTPLFRKLNQENILRDQPPEIFAKKAAHYFNEINAVHPFREGNGRTLRTFFKELGREAGYHIGWGKVDRKFYLNASIQGFHYNDSLMERVFLQVSEPLVKGRVHNKQTEVETTVNWLSPEYSDDWNNLRNTDHLGVQWMVKFYDLSKQSNKDSVSINKSISNQAVRIFKNQRAFIQIKQLAPKLATKIKQHAMTHTRNKAISIDI